MLGPMSNPYFNAGVIIGGERFLGRKRQIRRIQDSQIHTLNLLLHKET